MQEHKMYVAAPYFDLIANGLKTVEGRLFKPKFQRLSVGDTIQFFESKCHSKSIQVQIVDLQPYLSFEEMLLREGLNCCLPNITEISEGIRIYHSFSGYKEEEEKYGVLAIKIKCNL